MVGVVVSVVVGSGGDGGRSGGDGFAVKTQLE